MEINNHSDLEAASTSPGSNEGQACRRGPHLVAAGAQRSCETQLTEVSYRREAGAEQGAGGGVGEDVVVLEVVLVVVTGLVGPVEPLEPG